MFPSVMTPKQALATWIPINAPVILAVSALAGYLILQLMGGGGLLTGLAFGGFFSLASFGTLVCVGLMSIPIAECSGHKGACSKKQMFAIHATAITAALIISFFICNAIPSLPHMTPLQGLGLAGLAIGMFGVVNLIAYGCKRGYEAYDNTTPIEEAAAAAAPASAASRPRGSRRSRLQAAAPSSHAQSRDTQPRHG